MQRPFRVSLAVALAATSLQALAPAPVLAQEAKPKLFSALGQAESVDAAAKTVSIRRSELEPRQQLAQNDLVSFELNPDFRADHIDFGVSAEDLKIGDTVFLLRPNADGTRHTAPPLFPVAGWNRSNTAYNDRVEWMQVISLSPLTLRQGTLPDGANFENGLKMGVKNSVAGSYKGEIIGTYWDGTGQEIPTHEKYLQLNGRGEVTNFPTNSLGTTTRTVRLDKTENLQFDRYTPLTLNDIAAGLAADKILVTYALWPSPGGRQRIWWLLVADKN